MLRAPRDGVLRAQVGIGDLVEMGALLATVDGHPVFSPFAAVVRGLARDGLCVRAGVRIGDVDASGDRSRCFLVSDKALAVGGAVLGALLAHPKVGPPAR